MGRSTIRSAMLVAMLGATCAVSARPAAAAATDVVFIIDGSGSVTTAGFQYELSFVKNIVSALSPANTNIGALVFASTIHNTLALTSLSGTGTATVEAGLTMFTYPQGSGYVKLAFMTALNELNTAATAGDRKLAILVSDNGDPNPASQSPCSLATSLTAAGVRTYVVEGNINVGGQLAAESCLLVNPTADTFTTGTFAQLSTLQPTIVALIDPPQTVPEPASAGIVGLGLLGLGAVRRVRRQRLS